MALKTGIVGLPNVGKARGCCGSAPPRAPRF
jgi:hypothetical protein